MLQAAAAASSVAEAGGGGQPDRPAAPTMGSAATAAGTGDQEQHDRPGVPMAGPATAEEGTMPPPALLPLRLARLKLDSSDQLPPAGEALRRHDAQEQIGKGGFAQVWRGQLSGTGVAVKAFRIVPRGVCSEPFCRQVRPCERCIAAERAEEACWDDALAEVTACAATPPHPNLVRLLNATADCGGVYLLYELWDGPLSHYTERRRQTPIGPGFALEVEEIAKCLIRGLSHLHARRTVHTDIKTYNMLVKGNGLALDGAAAATPDCAFDAAGRRAPELPLLLRACLADVGAARPGGPQPPRPRGGAS
jgi:hypothetical protein